MKYTSYKANIYDNPHGKNDLAEGFKIWDIDGSENNFVGPSK